MRSVSIYNGADEADYNHMTTESEFDLPAFLQYCMAVRSKLS